MTDTIEPVELDEDETQQIAQRLVDQAKEQGVDLVGPGGVLAGLTKTVLETALGEELAEHLGYDKHDPVGRNGGNSRNGTRPKTVLTDVGPVELDVPRDREGTFDPQIVKKRQRRLDGVDQIVLSLTARGLTTGEVAAHFADVYGASVSKDTISRITEKVTAEMAEWQHRPLDRIYPVIFIDAIVVKVRDGQVTNKPFYVVIGVTTAGERDILGIWAGEGGEGAKFWLNVLTEIKNRGVEDVLIAVCDGLKGLPEAITTSWEYPQVQTCVIHLIRNTFRCAARQDWDQLAKDLKPVYTAVNSDQAAARLEEFAASGVPSTRPLCGCGATPETSSCRSSTTTSRSARSSAPPTRSSRPTPASGERSAPGATSPTMRLHSSACTWSPDRSTRPDPGRARWVIRWKAALNAFAITFERRINASDN